MRAGALALLTGGGNCGSIMLMLFLLPTTLIMHWPLSPAGDLEVTQLIATVKNLAILGGIIILRSSMAPRKDKVE